MVVSSLVAVSVIFLAASNLNQGNVNHHHQNYHAELKPGYRPLGRRPEPEPQTPSPDGEGSKSSSNPQQQPHPTVCPITLSVCVSPACASSGAIATLDKLRAFAPAHATVQAGTCISVCSYGPIVIESKAPQPNEAAVNHQKYAITKHRRVRAEDRDKILHFLQEISPQTPPPPAVVEGYELAMQAQQLYRKREYQAAVDLYERVVALSFRAAVDWQAQRDRLQHQWQHAASIQASQSPSGSSSSSNKSQLSKPMASVSPSTSTRSSPPVALEWLIRARRHQALCLLELGDIQASMLAAQAACNLSRNACPLSCLVLAQVYRKKGDAAGEYIALQTMFALLPSTSAATSSGETASRRSSTSSSSYSSTLPADSITTAQREQLASRLAQLEQQQQRRKK